jgi:hypothetical protein
MAAKVTEQSNWQPREPVPNLATQAAKMLLCDDSSCLPHQDWLFCQFSHLFIKGHKWNEASADEKNRKACSVDLYMLSCLGSPSSSTDV